LYLLLHFELLDFLRVNLILELVRVVAQIGDFLVVLLQLLQLEGERFLLASVFLNLVVQLSDV